MRVVVVRFAIAMVVLVGSLTLVAARQGSGMRVFADVERLRERIELEQASGDELVSEVRRLESRSVVLQRAADELGMRPAGGDLRLFEEGGR